MPQGGSLAAIKRNSTLEAKDTSGRLPEKGAFNKNDSWGDRK